MGYVVYHGGGRPKKLLSVSLALRNAYHSNSARLGETNVLKLVNTDVTQAFFGKKDCLP